MAVFNKDQLPEVITPNTIEYVMVFDKGSSEPRKVLKTKFDELYASSSTNGGPKEYIALLTQAGPHAPTTVVNSITVRTEVNDVSANDLLTNTVIHITVYP